MRIDLQVVSNLPLVCTWLRRGTESL